MPSGLIKLCFKGKKDAHLIGNPKFLFWKKSYKRHTNFSMQSINITNNEYIISEEKDYLFRFRIERNADLINFISLTVNLPDIYSSSGNNGEFKWNNNLGTSIIKYARLYFNDTLIEEIDGEFLLIYNNLYNPFYKGKQFNEMIGNIKELYDPYIDGEYKSYSKNIFTKNNNSHFYLNKYYNCTPSIEKFTLNIPLLFTFFRNKSNIPLICCKNTEIYVDILFRPIRDWYTIIKMESLILDSPINELKNILIHEFNPIETTINKAQRIKNPKSILNFTKNITLRNFAPELEINYIYLDNEEREQIVNNFHQLNTFVINMYIIIIMNKLKLILIYFIRLKI